MKMTIIRQIFMRRPTKVVKCYAEDSQYDFQKAKDVLNRKGVVAIPTDTLYGLVTLLKYSNKLNKVKRRPKNKPFGLFIHCPKDVDRYAIQTVPDELLKQLFPGPVTLLFQRNDQLPETFNPGVSTVGFRIPVNKQVKQLCALFPHMPLVQTSANVSGSELSPLCIQDFKELWDDIDLIIDDGPIKNNYGSRLGSTIVDLSKPGYYTIVRDGCALEKTVHILTSFGLKPTSLEQLDSTPAFDAHK